MNSIHCIPLLSALALALPCQDKPAPTVATGGPALVLKTSKEEIAADTLDFFEGAGELPELKPNQHWVLAVDQNKKISAAAADGDAGYLQIHARPALLMKAYAEQVDQVTSMIQMMGSMQLQASGMEAGEAMKLVQGLIDLPNQIDTFVMKISGNIEEPKKGGAEIAIDLQPFAGTGFGKFCAALKQASGGALKPTAGSLTVAVAFDPAPLSDVLQPFLDMAASMCTKDKAERKKAKDLMQEFWKGCDGSMAMSWSPGKTGMQIVAGTTDGPGMGKLMNSPEYVEMARRSALANPTMKVDYKPNAFEHRGVSVTQQTLTMTEDAAENPFFKDGKMDQMFAVAGSYLVCTVFGGKDDMVSAIDQALDQKFSRMPLASDTLLKLTMKFAECVAGFGAPVGGDAPDLVDITLGRNGAGIGVKVLAK
jgi:hypothetical protein